MRRKVIRQGHNTLTITLPTSWAKNFNLKAGDELELVERDNGLFLSTERKDDRKVALIDIEGLDIPTIWKYIMAVYREGYDEVQVKFNPNQIYDSPFKFYSAHAIDLKYGKKPLRKTAQETIHNIVSRFVGFEVMENYKDHCVIKDIGNISSKDFDASLRRVFLLIQQMTQELQEAIKTNDPDLVKHAHDIDINIDKFHDYCIRVLNKTGFKDIKKSHVMFSTLYLLELMGDEFKHIAYHILEDMKGKKLENLQELAALIHDQFNQFYDFFYNFDAKKINAMSELDFQVHFYLPKLKTKKPLKSDGLGWEELEIFNHFRRIGHYLNALTELRVEMEY